MAQTDTPLVVSEKEIETFKKEVKYEFLVISLTLIKEYNLSLKIK